MPLLWHIYSIVPSANLGDARAERCQILMLMLIDHHFVRGYVRVKNIDVYALTSAAYIYICGNSIQGSCCC